MNNSETPAYPIITYTMINDYGLTKREEFAARAMQGILSLGLLSKEKVANASLEYADALLKALEEN